MSSGESSGRPAHPAPNVPVPKVPAPNVSVPNVPGLDGIRAVSLLVVVAFHLGVPGFSGGFLGLPFFFALSGYLITQVILADSTAPALRRLGRFWSRRLRRLAPASIVVIVAIALSARFGVFEGRTLPGDLGAALGYVFNWRVASTGRSYSELFGSTPSPLLHFWSLAIEEQFYVVLPLVLLAVGAHRRRRTAIVVSIVALAASVTIGLATDSRDLVYYGTHVRAAEMLIGVLLAFVVPIGTTVGRRARTTVSVAAAAALVLFGVFVGRVDVDSDAVYDGLLVVVAMLTAIVIVDVVVGGWIGRILSWRPFVAVGKLSYGLYLFHWPVIVALDEERLGVGGWRLGVARIAITVVLALLSFVMLEQPIRARRRLVGSRRAGVAYLVSALIGVAAIVSLDPTTPTVGAGVDAPTEVVDFGGGGAGGPVGDDSESSTTTVPEQPSVVVVGSPGVGRDSVVAAIERRGLVVVEQGPATECPLGALLDEIDGCAAWSEIVESVMSSDVAPIVLLVGATERSLVDARVAADLSVASRPESTSTTVVPDTTVVNDDKRRTDAEVKRGEELARDLVAPFAGRTLLVVDAMGGDFLAGGLVDADLQSESVTTITVPDADADADVADADAVGTAVAAIVRSESSSDDRQRMIVIGDSVSFGVAQAIDATASDRYSVVWAGGRNCPLIEVERISWGGEMEFAMNECPTIDEWDRLWADVEPDLVLAIASVPEQSDQRYVADGEWHRVGDPEFARLHDAGIARLVEITERQGARLLFFNSSYIVGGGFRGAVFAADDRVDGWNRSLLGWAERHRTIEILDWASLVVEAESRAEGPGSLREDGVHMTPEDLANIVRTRLLDLLEPVESNVDE